MSPVFGHGRLRLYLLKLLDEAPRHGYEVIRLLQDRFMGVYAPSPGTIYPRLARLEEEGLLTHDEDDGRKTYRITDKGRDEINRRLDELDDLEREITESVSGIAREVKEDVRETVRSLREELTWATREVHKEGKRSAHEQASQRRDEARERARQVREELRQVRGEARGQARGRVGPEQDERAGGPEQDERAGGSEQDERPGGPEQDERPGGPEQDERPGGPEQDERPGSEWGGPGCQDWADWTNWADWPGRRHRPDAGGHGDFEAVARDFSNEVRRAIRQAGALGESAMDDIRLILQDALQRIRNEVFGPVKARRGESGSASGDTARGDTASGDTARRDTASGDTARRDTASGDTARRDTASGDTARRDTASGDTARAPLRAPPLRVAVLLARTRPVTRVAKVRTPERPLKGKDDLPEELARHHRGEPIASPVQRQLRVDQRPQSCLSAELQQPAKLITGSHGRSDHRELEEEYPGQVRGRRRAAGCAGDHDPAARPQ